MAKWHFNDLKSGEHRRGNKGMNARGELTDGSVRHKRDAIFYNGDPNKVAFCESGRGLVMKGYKEDIKDPTRKRYVDAQGRAIDWSPFQVKGAWLESRKRYWKDDATGHVEHHSGFDFKMNDILVAKVNFSAMMIEGFRHSGWTMPWKNLDGTWAIDQAYTLKPSDKADFDAAETDEDRLRIIARSGLEEDAWEVDPASKETIMMKVVGGAAGDTPNGCVDLKSNDNQKLLGADFDLFKGDHEICMARTPFGLYFFLDGHQMNKDSLRLSQIIHKVLLTNEGNTGLKAKGHAKGSHETESTGPWNPEDPGLYAKNMYHGIVPVNHLPVHEAVIKSLSIHTLEFGVSNEVITPKKPKDKAKKKPDLDLSGLGDIEKVMKKVISEPVEPEDAAFYIDADVEMYTAEGRRINQIVVRARSDG